MSLLGKCLNCKKSITDYDVNNNKGFVVNDETVICDRCYFMYFNRVRDYVYSNRTANMEEINKATGVSIKLLMYFFEAGALEEAIIQLDEQRKEESRLKSIEQKEQDERNKKIQILKGIKEVADEMRKDQDNQSSPIPEERAVKSSTVRFYMHDRRSKK